VPGPLRNVGPETEWQQHPIPKTLGVENLQGPHESPVFGSGTIRQLGLVALAESVTNHQKLMAGFDGQTWTIEALPPIKVRQVWWGPDGTRWAMGISSLFEWEAGAHADLGENEEISARQYFDLAVEPGGNFWLATSDGLFRYSPPLWRTPVPLRKLDTPVRCLATDPEGRLWFASGNRVYSFQTNQLKTYPIPPAAGRSLQIRSFYWLKSGLLAVAAVEPESSTGDQLFGIEPETGTVRPLAGGSPAPRIRALGLLPDGSLCLQSAGSPASEGHWSLSRFDGQTIQPIAEPPPVEALGTNLHAMFTAQNGDLWLGGDLGTAYFHEQRWLAFTSSDKSVPEAPVAFAELPDGKIWCAEQDQIWEFDGRIWNVVRHGFDRINALLRARDGSIWAACNNGLQRYVQGVWLENSLEEGLPASTVREVCEDQRGVWAATTRGVSLFHPEADRDPPAVSIQRLPSPGNSPADANVTSLYFAGQDKWRYTPASRLLFSYRLDDGDWSTYQEVDHVTYSDPSAGKHSLKVKALDRNGKSSKEPAQYDFAIILPWYKETRLVLIASTGLAAALFFAALAFNRHRRLVRSYAEVEKKVAERTLQLELASQELLQSQKMRALGTLAAGIAHDFNNILSIVKGSAQIIEDNLDNPHKIKSRADRIKTVVDQGAGIVRAMLGFSRDSGQEAGVCDINTVVDDTLKLLGDRFLREVQVKHQPTANLPPVIASKDFIQQILLNFIFNAAESMTLSKEILVSSRVLPELPANLVLVPVPAPSYVAISVSDSGCGIAPEILPRIFEPFFTTKALSSRRGTGLGLSMVYELAKKLGAGLFVESVLDQGSTFSLILPVQPVSNPVAAPADHQT
ncbi:MAG TPA: ATP-binding protein, partial [Verrucomicrobiae bacterium]|nr:ATP-binding protein [Verrucomicrobiae bacterium]